MKRINLYTLIIITIGLLLFCLAAVNTNAQAAENDESSVTRPGELVDELLARADELDERISGFEDVDQQDELWDAIENLALLVADLEREVHSFRDMSDRSDVLEALGDGPGPAYLDAWHCILATSGAGGPLLTLQHQAIVRYMA